MFERWGRRWECIRGYAVVEPEGWFFELWDVTDGPSGKLVLFARWPDGGSLSVTQYREGLSPEIVAWFTDETRRAIAPIHAKPGTAADRP